MKKSGQVSEDVYMAGATVQVLAVSAIVLFLVYPRFFTSVVQRLQNAPFKSL